jgi:hypothetical protein
MDSNQLLFGLSGSHPTGAYWHLFWNPGSVQSFYMLQPVLYVVVELFNFSSENEMLLVFLTYMKHEDDKLLTVSA